MDERLAAYGFETNTGVRFVVVVDMRGKPGAGRGGTSGGGTGGGGIGGIGGGGGVGGGGAGGGGTGLREGEMRPVFKAMQAAYVKLMQNPFYDPDEHSPGNGGPGKKITSRKFEEEIRRIGEGWTAGVTSL